MAETAQAGRQGWRAKGESRWETTLQDRPVHATFPRHALFPFHPPFVQATPFFKDCSTEREERPMDDRSLHRTTMRGQVQVPHAPSTTATALLVLLSSLLLSSPPLPLLGRPARRIEEHAEVWWRWVVRPWGGRRAVTGRPSSGARGRRRRTRRCAATSSAMAAAATGSPCPRKPVSNKPFN